MSEQAIEIRTADGTVDGYLYHPNDGAPAPGVVMLTDIGGLRASNRALAERLAGEGYVVLLPNVFYRTTRPPTFTFKMDFADERTRQRFAELVSPLKPDAVARDANAFLDYLDSAKGVRAGRAGVVGYCFTGGYALRVAAARPEQVVAAASFHGGGLFTDAPTSPHLVLPQVKARLYFGHADNDRTMPKESIDKLEAALAAWGGSFESEIYTGAAHGWTHPDASVYNEAQAERAFSKLTELFQATLR